MYMFYVAKFWYVYAHLVLLLEWGSQLLPSSMRLGQKG